MKPTAHCVFTVMLASLLALGGCRSLAEQRAGATTTGQPTPIDDAPQSFAPNNDCWYYELDEHRLIAVWVSPRLPGQVPGGFRFVNLFYHNADSKRPMLLHSNPVPSDQSHAIGLGSRARSFHVEPEAGKTWAQVVTRADLKVSFEGN